MIWFTIETGKIAIAKVASCSGNIVSPYITQKNFQGWEHPYRYSEVNSRENFTRRLTQRLTLTPGVLLVNDGVILGEQRLECD